VPNLWAHTDGSIPTQSWFISLLQSVFLKEIAGHSFHSGGATHLALMGIADNKIKAMGHWSSEAFWIYIQKNPIVLMALVSHKESLFDILSAHVVP
jgi:hypothetical protein